MVKFISRIAKHDWLEIDLQFYNGTKITRSISHLLFFIIYSVSMKD